MKRSHDNDSENDFQVQYPMIKSCRDYRARYPFLLDLIPKVDRNLKFYSNELVSYPGQGGTIEEILAKWDGDFKLLENHHDYIQWLFPLRIQGVNSKLHSLQMHEAQTISQSRIMKMRMIRAYQMMLRFYGLRLDNLKSGEVVRDLNFQDRLIHLLNHSHNFLRITRIIQSLGELGWQHLQKPLVTVFVDLLSDSEQLKTMLNKVTGKTFDKYKIRSFRESCITYWVNSILDDSDWREMRRRVRLIERNNS